MAVSIRANDLVPVLGNVNVVLIRLSFEEHSFCASLPAVFGNIYYIYDFFAQCNFYCKSFPFSFLFFDGTMLFFEEMKDTFTAKESERCYTCRRVFGCVCVCVSVSCGDCLD